MYLKFIEYTVAVLIVVSVGCTRGPDRVELPDFDPEQMGVRAVEMYDKDGSGSISAEELQQVRSLESAMAHVDVDGDKSLTADEIAARIRHYQKYRAGLLSVFCTLNKGGRPVAGAKVTYEPEAFMGEGALPAFGSTNSTGGTVMSIAEEHRPSPAATGVRPGFYRVRVTLANGKEVTDLDAGVEAGSGLLNNHSIAMP